MSIDLLIVKFDQLKDVLKSVDIRNEEFQSIDHLDKAWAPSKGGGKKKGKKKGAGSFGQSQQRKATKKKASSSASGKIKGMAGYTFDTGKHRWVKTATDDPVILSDQVKQRVVETLDSLKNIKDPEKRKQIFSQAAELYSSVVNQLHEVEVQQSQRPKTKKKTAKEHVKSAVVSLNHERRNHVIAVKTLANGLTGGKKFEISGEEKQVGLTLLAQTAWALLPASYGGYESLIDAGVQGVGLPAAVGLAVSMIVSVPIYKGISKAISKVADKIGKGGDEEIKAFLHHGSQALSDEKWSQITTKSVSSTQFLPKDMLGGMNRSMLPVLQEVCLHAIESAIGDLKKNNISEDVVDRAINRTKKFATGKDHSISKARKLADRTEIRGFKISIENDKGDVREGDGWRTLMRSPYGYIRMTEGVDGDHFDLFLGPEAQKERRGEKSDWDTVYVMHMNDHRTGEYDEDKAGFGYLSAKAFVEDIRRHYDDPDRFVGPVSEYPIEKFRELVYSTRENPRRLGEGKKIAIKGFAVQLLKTERDIPTDGFCVEFTGELDFAKAAIGENNK